jgi:TatD DNase family protein
MIDSHCHLADDVFAADAAAVVARATGAGVTGALCILDAGSPVERERASELAGLWPALRFAVGVHPHQAGAWAERVDVGIETVRSAAEGRSDVRAVGEIGLDYHYDFAPRALQRDIFARQIALAVTMDMPVVIHAREADEDVLAVLREAGGGRVRGVMHCFTGPVDFARRVLDEGLYVSLAGIVTFPKAEALREVARLVPPDRLLLETDSPFLAPVPYRGTRNEPARVAVVAARVATERGLSQAALVEQTTKNFERLFGPRDCAGGPKGLVGQGLAR